MTRLEQLLQQLDITKEQVIQFYSQAAWVSWVHVGVGITMLLVCLFFNMFFLLRIGHYCQLYKLAWTEVMAFLVALFSLFIWPYGITMLYLHEHFHVATQSSSHPQVYADAKMKELNKKLDFTKKHNRKGKTKEQPTISLSDRLDKLTQCLGVPANNLINHYAAMSDSAWMAFAFHVSAMFLLGLLICYVSSLDWMAYDEDEDEYDDEYDVVEVVEYECDDDDYDDDDDDDDDDELLCVLGTTDVKFVVVGIFLFFSIFVVGNSLARSIQATVSPKSYALEQIVKNLGQVSWEKPQTSSIISKEK